MIRRKRAGKAQLTFEKVGEREELKKKVLPIDKALEANPNITIDQLEHMKAAYKRDLKNNIKFNLKDYALENQETIRRIDEAIKRKRGL